MHACGCSALVAELQQVSSLLPDLMVWALGPLQHRRGACGRAGAAGAACRGAGQPRGTAPQTAAGCTC